MKTKHEIYLTITVRIKRSIWAETREKAIEYMKQLEFANLKGLFKSTGHEFEIMQMKDEQ